MNTDKDQKATKHFEEWFNRKREVLMGLSYSYHAVAGFREGVKYAETAQPPSSEPSSPGSIDTKADKDYVHEVAGILMKPILDLLQTDPHQWSARPCSTCDTISALAGRSFGCVKYGKNQEATS